MDIVHVDVRPESLHEYHGDSLIKKKIVIIYMFQCHSPILSCPHPLPQRPKDCSVHLCLFCRLAYRVANFLKLSPSLVNSLELNGAGSVKFGSSVLCAQEESILSLILSI